MNRRQFAVFSGVLLSTAVIGSSYAHADALTDALANGKVKGDIRLRYESVEQDNPVDDATALTVRTRLGYTTGEVDGFSATVEFEDSRIVAGQSDYTVGPTGFNPGEFSVIADPESTEIDQGFIQYKSGGFTGKLGRQMITLDNHRFLGHVAWRQDRQTYDGLFLNYKPAENIDLNYIYIEQRNRIFAQAADVDSKDHLLNASYKFETGKLTGYGYFLEVDPSGAENETLGLRYSGNVDLGAEGGTKLSYAVEFATQETNNNEADYSHLELGADFGTVKATLGYEVLGSDDGNYGFTTPLATLHKFNGWADQFLATPAQGLTDFYIGLSGKAGGGKWAVIYHDFSADDASATVDDLGDELDLLYAKKIGKYSTGIKYSAYSAGDIKVDADKLWIWGGVSF